MTSVLLFNIATLLLDKLGSKKSIFMKGRSPLPLREHLNILKVRGFIENEMGISFQGHPRYDHMISVRTELELMEKYVKLFNRKISAFSTAHALSKMGWGRTNPAHYCSANIMHRPTRHALCKDIYEDWDMVNAHVSMLCGIFKKREDVDVSALVEYNKDAKSWREEIMRHHGTDKESAKQLFIRMLFGGSYMKWIKDYDVQQNIKAGQFHPLVIQIENQLIKVREVFYNANPQIVKDLKTHNSEKYSNATNDELKRSVLAIALQTIERWIMESCVLFLVEEKGFVLQDIVPCQDGFMILKKLSYNGLREDIERITFEKFGLNIGWIRKEFDEAIEIPDGVDDISHDEFRHADDDESAARMVITDLKDALKYSFNRLFIKKDHVWISEPSEVKNSIFVSVLSSNIKKQNVKGDWNSYTQNAKNAASITTSILSIVREEGISDDLFYNKFISTTKGRVCFKDGVLDFASRRFYLWNEIDFEYYPRVMINYEFSDYFKHPDLQLSNHIAETVFKPLFRDKIDLAIQFMSRAIAGHSEDKNWASLLGKRDNGKGVIFDGLKNAFGGYVSSFEIENLMYQRKRDDTGECSKKNSWMLNLETTRLAISQEIPDTKSGLLLNYTNSFSI